MVEKCYHSTNIFERVKSKTNPPKKRILIDRDSRERITEIKHREWVFEFLVFEQVPYDNNGSERSVRPLKVKQKVSGTFNSKDGADAFCQLYSIVNTAKKNKQAPFLALIAVAKNVCAG